MSTPQTLVQAIPPHQHQHLDHRQRYLPSPQDRYLPPPRPSSGSNLGVGHGNSNSNNSGLPARPSSNASNPQFAPPYPPPPPRSHSGMSNPGHGNSSNNNIHSGNNVTYPEYTYTNGLSSSRHESHDERLSARGGSQQQHSRTLPHPHIQHSQPAHASQTQQQQQAMPYHTHTHTHSAGTGSVDANSDDYTRNNRRRREKAPVDWVAFYGGRPPAEIITIHDDDSPAPTTTTTSTAAAGGGGVSVQRLPGATSGNSSAAGSHHHADKRRRVNGGGGSGGDAGARAQYSATNTPYSLSHHNSTDSLQTNTAPTSLGSQASTSNSNGNGNGGRLDASGAQTGQKRKRTRLSEHERLEQERALRVETERKGGRGYLAEYGEYIPPPKQQKKQKEVHVPTVQERTKTTEKVDDEDGHYIVHENSRLGERYNLLQLLGQGTFGKVVKALDIRTRREVAVKIIRAVPKYRDASRIELRVLQTLRAADEHNRNRCIQLRDCFDWRGHICIVTPLLGLSVFDFLKSGGFVPFPGSHIQAFARQLLGSIAFLHDLNLIHTDLKPENILLLDHTYQTFTYNRNIPSSSQLTERSSKFRRVLLAPQINLIDFGSATFDDEYHSSVVSTRHYRAPEIILGIGWSHPIDLWSLGCILVECWTGDALFQTHDCAEHLGMMEMVTGNLIDKSLIREVNRIAKRTSSSHSSSSHNNNSSNNGDRNQTAARFFKNGRLAYPLPDTPRHSRKFVRSMRRLEDIIPPTSNFNKMFLDLLRAIFVYDPKKRISAREALKHPWFDELVEDDGTEAAKIKVEKDRQEAASASASASHSHSHSHSNSGAGSHQSHSGGAHGHGQRVDDRGLATQQQQQQQQHYGARQAGGTTAGGSRSGGGASSARRR